MDVETLTVCNEGELELPWPLSAADLQRLQGHGVFVLGRSSELYGVVRGSVVMISGNVAQSLEEGNTLIHTRSDCQNGRAAVQE